MRRFLSLLSLLPLLAALSAHADTSGEALAKRAREAMARLESLRANVELEEKAGRSSGTLQIKRPNLVRLDLAGADAMTLASDGATMFRYYPARGTYLRLKPGPTGESVLLPGVYDVGFFRPLGESRINGATAPVLTVEGRDKVDGTDCDILQAVSKSPTGAVETTRCAIGADGLVHRIERKTEAPNGGVATATLTLTHLQVNAGTVASDFQWKPPADAKPFNIAVLAPLLRRVRVGGNADNDYASDLPKVGAKVPDFELERPGGGKLALLATAGKQKLTLVNFWFVNCPPCRAEFPRLQALYQQLKDRGLEIVSINHGDTEDRVTDYVKQGGFTFNILMGGAGPGYVGKTYGVRAYPTNILIDSTGKVLWRSVGFNEDALRQALKQAGLEAPPA